MSLEHRRLRQLRRTGLITGVAAIAMAQGFGAGGTSIAADPYLVVAYNDLGMHCMNEDFSELCILPPFNTLHAVVIRRGEHPNFLTGGVTVSYAIPSSARSADKTNFWKHAPALFGVALPPDIGLAGAGLRGTMTPRAGANFWEVVGIPITPTDDLGNLNPYPLADVRVTLANQQIARTQTVVPVSQEISCFLCHNESGVSTETDILRDHDRLHGTTLEQQKPVLCAACHADPALGAPGSPGVSMLSHAMHGAHADRMDILGLANNCYACHPGLRTQCQRDVHFSSGVVCIDCHGDMAAVGNPNRTPWADQPRCGSCHSRPGYQFEEPGKLFKDSRGHGGTMCFVCHGSPHAIAPAVTEVDNAQALRLQGHAGVIDDCLVCHTERPTELFFHSIDD